MAEVWSFIAYWGPQALAAICLIGIFLVTFGGQYEERKKK